MEPIVAYKDPYLISTDPARLDIDIIHNFLANQSYWARGISRTVIEKAVQHSLCFGMYLRDEAGERQVGFARVVTDYAISAHIADVFILEDQRGRGLSKWLIQVVLDHPELQGLRRWTLATVDAHGLYARFGFRPLGKPERHMEMAPHRKEAS